MVDILRVWVQRPFRISFRISFWVWVQRLFHEVTRHFPCQLSRKAAFGGQELKSKILFLNPDVTSSIIQKPSTRDCLKIDYVVACRILYNSL